MKPLQEQASEIIMKLEEETKNMAQTQSQRMVIIQEEEENKQGRNQLAIFMRDDNIENSNNIGRKIKFPCRICKGDHLLNHFPCIPKVLEVWSTGSQQPMLPTIVGHVNDNPSTSDHHAGEKG
jgi:hypothetical protein